MPKAVSPAAFGRLYLKENQWFACLREKWILCITVFMVYFLSKGLHVGPLNYNKGNLNPKLPGRVLVYSFLPAPLISEYPFCLRNVPFE